MTTPYTPERIWADETVAIVGNADLSSDALDALSGCKIIALNRAINKVPHADMLVSIDANWPACDGFKGPRIVGAEMPDVDANYVHMPYEIVTLSPGNVAHLRNNGLFALRLAVQMGAAKILLLGFNPAQYELQLLGEDPVQYKQFHDFQAYSKGLEQLLSELAAQGVEVAQIA